MLLKQYKDSAFFLVVQIKLNIFLKKIFFALEI